MSDPTQRRRAYLGPWIRWGLRLLGPLLLVLILLRLPSAGELVTLFAQASIWPLAASLAINIVAIHLKVVRWQVLLRVRGIRYRTTDAWIAFSASLYLAMLTPGRVGDVLRIQYLRHDTGAPYAEGLASVVMDRFCDLYVLVALVAVSVSQYGRALSPELARLGWTMVAVTALAPLVLLAPRVPELLFPPLYRRLSGDGDARGLHTFLEALRAQVGRALLLTLPLTFVSFLVGFGQAWLLSIALGIDLGYLDVARLIAIASLVGLLPISISGVGLREAFFVAVFPALGHTEHEAVAFGLLVFLVIYLSLAGIGFIAWQTRPPPLTARDPTS